MSLGGLIGGLLQKYAGSGAPTEQASEHYDQVSKNADPSLMADAIGSMMRSSDTPPFADIVGQLFGRGTGEQKASMLNAILASAGPAVLSQLSGLIPGISAQTQVSAAQAQAVPADAVTQIANHAEQQDPTVIDRMSQVYAQHPALVQTLGTGAMIIALREIAKRLPSQNS